MNFTSSSTTNLPFSPSSTTATTTVISTASRFSSKFPNSYQDIQILFPADFNYFFNYTVIGMENNLHFIAETLSQSIAAASSLIVSPTSALDVSRGFALSRIASCQDRDPLANGERWNQKRLKFPETFLPVMNPTFGFGTRENGFFLRVGVLSFLLVLIIPVITSAIFVKPVAPIAKAIAIFFSISLALSWGFSSGVLIGAVSSANSDARSVKYFYQQQSSSSSSSSSSTSSFSSDILIIDWVIGILPVCLPLLVMIFFSRKLHLEIVSPEHTEDEVLLLQEQEMGLLSSKNKLVKNKNDESDDDFDDCEADEDEEEEEEEDENNHSFSSRRKKSKVNPSPKKQQSPSGKRTVAEIPEANKDDADEKNAATLEDERKRKQKKTNLHLSISKVQFRVAGVGKKSPWKVSLRDWLNNSRLAKFLFFGNYIWKGGDLPVLQGLMSFAELEKLRQERLAVKKKQEEDEKKSGKKKKKGFFDQLSESDDDDDDTGGKFKRKSGFTGVRGSYGISKKNFFDDDDDADAGGGGEGDNFFDNGDSYGDDGSVPAAVNEDDMEVAATEEEEAEKKRLEEEQQKNRPPETEKEKKKREKLERKQQKEKEEQDRKKKLLEDLKEDFKLPPRPELTSAQIILNRLGFVVENFYGPPEPLSVTEANRQNIRLPWREKFALFAPHYFVFNAILSTLFSLLSGIVAACPECYCVQDDSSSSSSQQNTSKGNFGIFYGLTIIAAIDLVFVAICRPYLVGIHNALTIASDGLVIASCILVFLKLPPDESTRVFIVQVITLFGVSGVAAARIFFVVVKHLILHFGDLRITSIYYGKKDKEIKVLQKKIKKKEVNDAEAARIEREKNTSTAVVKKRGGPYLNQQDVKGLMNGRNHGNNDNNDDEDILLLSSLPRVRSGSKFKRRTKSLMAPPSASSDEQRNDDYDEDDENEYSSGRSSSAPSYQHDQQQHQSSPRYYSNDHQEDDEDDSFASPPSRTPRRSARKNSTPTSSSRSLFSRASLKLMQDSEI